LANRPIFIPTNKKEKLFEEKNIEFKFYNGFASSQKIKSVKSLHNSAEQEGYNKILEISTYSNNELGYQLSAFNLLSNYQDKKIPLECAFQGSKVFEFNKQYTDLYHTTNIKAKKDKRLKESGKIIGFFYEDEFWENEPKTAFYDWLYISTIYKNYYNLIEELTQYQAFTDIAFNPKKSLNCQARSCAILVSLYNLDLLQKALLSKENFIKIVYSNKLNEKKSNIIQNPLF
jgi:hypothetical protein